MQNLKMAWMWAADDGDTHGLEIDSQSHQLRWYEGLACGCGDSALTQTPQAFRVKGALLNSVPADVLTEIRATVAALLAEG